jgi:hypothetical protein
MRAIYVGQSKNVLGRVHRLGTWGLHRAWEMVIRAMRGGWDAGGELWVWSIEHDFHGTVERDLKEILDPWSDDEIYDRGAISRVSWKWRSPDLVVTLDQAYRGCSYPGRETVTVGCYAFMVREFSKFERIHYEVEMKELRSCVDALGQ